MESTKLQVLAPDPFPFRPMTGSALSIANVGTLDFSEFRRGASGLLADSSARNAGQ